MRQIIIDTETTGLDPKNGHKIVEIACLEIMDFQATGRIFHEYVDPERLIPQEAMAVHGISDEDLIDKPKFSEIMEEFFDFIGNDPLVAHNMKFDINFILSEIRKTGSKRALPNSLIDTMMIARTLYPKQKVNLDALRTKLRINCDDRTFHGALLDCQILAKVYKKLMVQDQTTLDLMPEIVKKVEKKKERKHRIFPLSEEEKQQHADFVRENVKNSMWSAMGCLN